MLDPACGTGGMLSVAEDHLRELNPDARLEVFGQELNAETYAICRSDMMLKGQDAVAHRARQLVHRGRPRRASASTTCSPTRRSGWSGRRSSDEVRGRARDAGLRRPLRRRPAAHQRRLLLFLQHMISKMKPAEEGGSRLAIVFNGSPLFTGAAGSGESEIRRWIIENDWLEAIVALPTSSSTTPASPPTSGSSPTARRPSGAARCSSSTPASFREDAEEPRREAQGDQRRRRSTRSPASTATSRRASR